MMATLAPAALADLPAPDWQARFALHPSAQRNIAKPADWLQYPFPFVYGQIDPTLFPQAEWRECCERALRGQGSGELLADRIDRDDPLLIEQIQARLLPRRGIFANPDEIIVTLGAQNALYMLATLLMGKGTKVSMEGPGYPDARSIFKLAGAEIAPTPVDHSGIVTSAIPNDADFVFVTPSHHCPTMVPMSAERRQDILARAQQFNQVIIEDGYDSQLIDQAPQQALKSLDRSGGEALAQRLKAGQRLVSREGDLWRWDGFAVAAHAPTLAARRLAEESIVLVTNDGLDWVGAPQTELMVVKV